MGTAAQRGSPVRVLLVERHPNIRAVLRAELEDVGFDICADVATADEAVELAQSHRPELCLLDVAVDGGAPATVTRLLAAAPSLRIVLLSVSRDDDDLAASIRAGAVGYLPKDVRAARLAEVIAATAAGATLLPRTLSSRP